MMPIFVAATKHETSSSASYTKLLDDPDHLPVELEILDDKQKGPLVVSDTEDEELEEQHLEFIDDDVENATDDETLADVDLDTNTNAKELLRQERWKAIFPTFLCLTAAIFFTAMSFLIKVGGATIPSFELAFSRSVIQFILGLLVLAKQRVAPFGTEKRLVLPLVLRGILSFTGMSCYFYAVTKLPLGEAVVISFTSPVFTAILAMLILKEKWEKLDAFGAVLSLTGVVFIARPPFLFPSNASHPVTDGATQYLAVGLAICGAFCGASASVLTRRLGTQVHALVNVNYFSFASMILCPIGMLATGQFVWPTLPEIGIMIVLGVCAFIGQYMINVALQLETAAKVATLGYIQVAYAFVLELIFFKTYPDIWSIAGVILICLWALVSILKKWKSVAAKHLKFLRGIKLKVIRSKLRRKLMPENGI